MIAIGYLAHFAPLVFELGNIGKGFILGAVHENFGNFKLGKPLNQFSVIRVFHERRAIVEKRLWR